MAETPGETPSSAVDPTPMASSHDSNTRVSSTVSGKDGSGVRRVVLILGCLLSVGMEVWLFVGVGFGGEGATFVQYVFGVAVLALLALLNIVPFILYRKFVKTKTLSIIGGIVLVGQYFRWFPIARSEFHPGNDLFLMVPVVFAFWSLLIALTTIAVDGVLRLVASRRLPDGDSESPTTHRVRNLTGVLIALAGGLLGAGTVIFLLTTVMAFPGVISISGDSDSGNIWAAFLGIALVLGLATALCLRSLSRRTGKGAQPDGENGGHPMTSRSRNVSVVFVLVLALLLIGMLFFVGLCMGEVICS